MPRRKYQYRWHEPQCMWLPSFDTEAEFNHYLETEHMTLPTYLPDDIIKAIQVKEEEDIANKSVEELSTLIEKYQRATRELQVREYTVRKKLHSKLSSLTDTEVEKYITKVPPAESELRARRDKKERDSAGERKVQKPKKGRPSFESKLEALALTNPEFKNFLDSLGPPKK